MFSTPSTPRAQCRSSQPDRVPPPHASPGATSSRPVRRPTAPNALHRLPAAWRDAPGARRCGMREDSHGVPGFHMRPGLSSRAAERHSELGRRFVMAAKEGESGGGGGGGGRTWRKWRARCSGPSKSLVSMYERDGTNAAIWRLPRYTGMLHSQAGLRHTVSPWVPSGRRDHPVEYPFVHPSDRHRSRRKLPGNYQETSARRTFVRSRPPLRTPPPARAGWAGGRE